MDPHISEDLAKLDALIATGNQEGALTLADSLADILSRRGELGQLIPRYVRLLQILTPGSYGMAAILARTGTFHRDTGRLDEAIDYLKRALEIDQSLGWADGEVVCLQTIAECYVLRGEYATALIHLFRALEVAKKSNLRELILRTTGDIGLVCRDMDDLSGAIHSFEQVLTLAEHLKEESIVATALHNLGICYRRVGDLARAFATLQRAREIAERLGLLNEQAGVLDALGNCYAQAGEVVKSIECGKRALTLSEKTGHLHGQAVQLANIGQRYFDLEEYSTANEFFNRAVDRLEQMGVPADHHEMQAFRASAAVAAILRDGLGKFYLTEVSVRDVRSIHNVTWQLPAEKARGWHVILGDNGSGKSTLLRSIALALIGSREAAALRQRFDRWLRTGSDTGQIDLTLTLPRTKRAQMLRSQTLEGEVVPPAESVDSGAFTSMYMRLGLDLRREGAQVRLEERAPYEREFWESSPGPFSAAYGPFRRFADADPEYERTVSAQPRVGRHISLFDSRVTLAESITWLHQLKLKKLDGEPEGALLEPFTQLVNDPGPPSFLPHGARLEDASKTTMHVVDGEGVPVPLEDLSDGHRAVLSLQFDLIRHMAAVFGSANVFSPENRVIVQTAGIVLIDEIDVHLHPTWQQRIGIWFKHHFPNIQFIVTTHSPLVCQAADSVFVLPTPGTDREARMLEGVALDRVRYGNVLEAYGTEVFGQGVTRSEESRKMLRRLVELNRNELEQGLSDGERDEQQRLRAVLPTAAPLVPSADGGGP